MIRAATADDAEELIRIYSYYVKETAITFEYEVPSNEEFRERIKDTLRRFPYIVCVRDGRIAGYAYAGYFKERRAYDWACETTVYVDRTLKTQGIGKELYGALEAILRNMNMINLNACIAFPVREDEYLTENSVHFHEHMGYRLVGRFTRCGYKFDRWYDMVWMEKFLSEHPARPRDIIPFEPYMADDL